MRITRVGTVVALGELPSARVLQASLAAHAPGVALTVLALPGAFTEARRVLGEAGADVLRLRDMRGATHPGLTASSPDVQRRVMAPALVRHLLDDDGAAALLPVDGALFGPLGALEGALSGSSLVVIPRFSGALPDDGKRPDAADLDRLGPVDPDLVAAAPGAAELLEWWLAREVERHDLGRHGRGTRSPAPGTPLAAVGRAFPGVATCEDPGVGVSPWNLHQRPLGRTAAGALTAAGVPLVLMRFPGFRPDRPWWLSDDASRVEVLDDPVLSELLRSRAEELERAGWRAPEHKDADVGELIHRVHTDERLRELQAEAHRAGEDFGGLDDPVAREAFLRWLVVPVRGRLNTYALRVYRERPDVSVAYADLDDPGAQAAFVRWLWDHGRHEMQLPDALLPPPDPGSTAAPAGSSSPSVLVLGYLRGRLGLGQAGRGTASALRAAGAEVTTHAVALDAERAPFEPPAASAPGARDDADEHAAHAYEGAAEAVAAADVVVVSVNAPQLPGVLGAIGPEPFAGRYVVGQWAWEASGVPNGWEEAFDAVDEVWVYSSYVADVISRASTKPVVVVPLPVEVPDEWVEPSVELPAGEFMFLFAFDLLSTLERKNPLGTIEAYRRAFGPDEGSTLVVKTVSGSSRPQELAALQAAAADRPDIAILDASLPAAEMAGLMRRADAYVSLHRSEGFGLTPAEAMALGKPVIATRFGGNLDFMHAENSLLVDYELRRIGPDAEHYPADGVWAEPSVEHAAALMRSVRDDPSRAARLGARAQREIAERLSPRAVGIRALQRLAHVTSLRIAAAPGGPDALGFDVLEQAIAFDLDGGGEGPRGALRRAVMRVIEPYAASRREADLEMVRVLRSLAWQLDRLEAARERDRDRIARLERRLAD